MVETNEPPGRGLRLLSLDGGVNRGISILIILKALLSHLQEVEGQAHDARLRRQELPRLWEYFDLIGGTNTGGIIALMLGRLQLDVNEAIELYTKLTSRVFSDKNRKQWGNSKDLFKSSTLEEELRAIIGEKTGARDALLIDDGSPDEVCRSFVIARNQLNMNAGIPVLFRTYTHLGVEHEACTIWQAARATSATPGLFKPMVLGRSQPYVDGGMGCNNPTRILLSEAAKLFPGQTVASVISIGTGHPSTINLGGSSSASMFDTLKKMVFDCEGTHEEMMALFAQHKSVYYRFSVQQGLQKEINGGEANLVEAHTDAYLAKQEVKILLREAAEVVIQADGKVPVERLVSAPPRPRRERVFITPAPPSPIFIGREDVIEKMNNAFFRSDPDPTQRQNRFVLYGMGGSGKTQIALKFIDMFSDRFTKIYYIDASSTELLNAHFEDIGLEAKLPEPSAANTRQYLTRLTENYLILYDNADDRTINLHDWFPRSKYGNIIITSRNPECVTHALPPSTAHSVAELREDEAVGVLLAASRRPPDPNDTAAVTLVNTLCRLALAVAQAGAFIANDPNLTFNGYLELYQERRKELLQATPNQKLDEYAYSVFTTWEISFLKVSHLSKAFLGLCGFFHYDGIAMDILSSALSTVRDRPEVPEQDVYSSGVPFLQRFSQGNFEWNEGTFAAMIQELFAYSLIQPSAAQLMFSIHPLVHAWARDRLPPRARAGTMELALQVLSLSVTKTEDEPGFGHRRLLLPHINSILKPADKANLAPDVVENFTEVFLLQERWAAMEEFWNIIRTERLNHYGVDNNLTLEAMRWLGTAAREQGRYAEAETIQSEVLNRRKTLLGIRHPDTLTSMAHLALTYFHRGRYVEAEKLNSEVLDLRGRVLGPDHPETLRSLASLAATYWQLGRHSDSEALEREVLELQENKLGPEHPDTLNSMGNLATTLSGRGKYVEAESLETKLLEIRKRVFGLEHPYTLGTMANLASTYSDQGRYAEAQTLNAEVLKLQREVLGEKHPDTLGTMANVAMVYGEEGRYDEARLLEVEILEEYKILLGPEHPDTLTSMANLGNTLQNLDEYEKAEALELQVLEARKRVLGEDHPDTLTSMSNLAATYLELEKESEAEAMGLAALEICKRVLMEESPETLQCVGNLALTYSDQERHAEAEELLEKVLSIQKRVLGPEHPQTLDSMANLALIYSDQEKLEQAEALNVQALALRRQVLGLEHRDTVQSLGNLASILQKQGRMAEAEPLRIEQLKLSRSILGVGHKRTLVCMEKLIEILWALGRREGAEELKKELLDVRRQVLPPGHPDIVLSMVNLVRIYKDTGKGEMEEAIRLQHALDDLAGEDEGDRMDDEDSDDEGEEDSDMEIDSDDEMDVTEEES